MEGSVGAGEEVEGSDEADEVEMQGETFFNNFSCKSLLLSLKTGSVSPFRRHCSVKASSNWFMLKP